MSNGDMLHVAVIMDGNGRWATRQGQPRSFGHCAGVASVRSIVRAAIRRPIRTLTLFAFSVDNWRRPWEEVAAIFDLMCAYLESETAACVERGIRFTAIGRKEGLNDSLRAAIDHAERATCQGSRLWLRIALNYSSRDAILAVAAHPKARTVRSRREFALLLSGTAEPAPDVDLLIRTGGERRLSDFLLWECAYAEMYFTPVSWPDFGPGDLDEALDDFRRRERRFGEVRGPESAVIGAAQCADAWLE